MLIDLNSRRVRVLAVCLMIVLSTAGSALAAEQKGTTPEKSKAEKPDPFVVPNGTPAELLRYIEGLEQLKSAVVTRDAVAFFRKKKNRAIIEAAGKILAAKPDAEQAKSAVEWKIGSLIALERLGAGSAAKSLEAMPDELKKAGHAELAREVRGFLLSFGLRRAMRAGPKQIEESVAEVVKFLSEAPPTRGDVRLAMMAAQVAERGGNNELAASAYHDFGKIFAASDDTALAKIGLRMVGAARRMGLIGKPMKIEGTTLAGKPLDWAKYRGKVVLVNFWATWCAPCRAEIPNVQKNYDLYHGRGFDVVAINCDDSREALDAFLKKTSMPGTILFSDEKGAVGMDNPTATYYGILGIPALILVGADGNVVSLEARGPALGQELEKLLGPVEKGK